MANLANSYSDAGECHRATRLFEEAVAVQKAKLRRDHPDTLNSMNMLAGCYLSAGENDRAIRLFEETLALRKAKLGPDHLDTLTTMGALANSYAAAGQSDRAARLFEEAVAVQKAKLTPDHPILLGCLENQARLPGELRAAPPRRRDPRWGHRVASQGPG